MVDPILIEQVVLNLLKNAAEAIDNAAAADAAPAASSCASCRATRAEEGDVIEFTVTDKGPGLKDEVHRAHVRGVLLDQGRRPGHRPQPVPLDHREPPRPDQGGQPLQWRHRRSAAASRSRCRSTTSHARSAIASAGRSGVRSAQPKHSHEPDSQEGHRLRRRRRRGRARFAAVAARRQGLPRQVLRLGRVVPVALRPARGRLPDRRHPHGRHERPRAAGPPARARARRCR